MEIELTGLKKIFLQRTGLAALLLLPLALCLGWLGSHFTPADPAGYPLVLSWSEWQVIQAKRVYAAELGTLRREAANLGSLLDHEPDPVRAQITAERIARTFGRGQPALTYQRGLLVAAAQAIQDWSVGALPLEQARAAMQSAVRALELDGEQP